MAQYCRYCLNLTGENHVCAARGYKQIPEGFCKHTNKCTHFEFTPKDYFMENKRDYRPREKKAMQPCEKYQTTLF